MSECEREREWVSARERERVCVCESERERERETESVCERERVGECERKSTRMHTPYIVFSRVLIVLRSRSRRGCVRVTDMLVLCVFSFCFQSYYN